VPIPPVGAGVVPALADEMVAVRTAAARSRASITTCSHGRQVMPGDGHDRAEGAANAHADAAVLVWSSHPRQRPAWPRGGITGRSCQA
jgi:hypothetical protein